MNTKPEVFVIESLTFDHERQDLYEGQIISKILALSGKHCEYYYIRTQRELKEVMKIFTTSRYRYLHLSCHGSEDTMGTTLDNIPLADLADLMKPHLDSRRLFVSACSMTNHRLARTLMPQSGCISILGPDQNIHFGDAAILWASLYHVMFSADATAMKRKILVAKAREVANMYQVRLRYFAMDDSSDRGYSETKIAPETDDA